MWLSYPLLFLATGVFSATLLRFTNVECELMNPSYVTFERCDLKVIGRGTVGLSIFLNLTEPITNAKINLSVWRKFNGYRPFMFNFTFDFCNLMAQKKTMLSFPKLFFESLIKTSNINHSCPYYNTIKLHNMVVSEEHYKFVPLPTGEYKYQLKVWMDNEWRLLISVYVLRQEDLMKT